MIFLVVSNPRPERPSDVVGSRRAFWPWIEGYRAKGICRDAYPRVGRGAMAIFDVEGNAVLHRILTEWADIVPAEFEILPLMDRSEIEATLASSNEASNPAVNIAR